MRFRSPNQRQGIQTESILPHDSSLGPDGFYGSPRPRRKMPFPKPSEGEFAVSLSPRLGLGGKCLFRNHQKLESQKRSHLKSCQPSTGIFRQRLPQTRLRRKMPFPTASEVGKRKMPAPKIVLTLHGHFPPKVTPDPLSLC